LANRIADLYHEVAKVRQTWTANEVKLDMFGDTVNALLSMLHLKFAWVKESPYVIWSVKDAGSAAHFLRARDEEVKRGQPPHRVTEHFAGLGQHSLRGDMEAYASGQKPSSRLVSELQAYSLCVLEDAWPESLRRDVSNFTTRAKAGKAAAMSANLRLKQNLEAF